MISRRFSVTQHVDAILAGCAQTLFALRTLRQHGMPNSALHAVFQATAVNKLSYAVSAWWGVRECCRPWPSGGLPPSVCFCLVTVMRPAPSLAYICAQADDKLFNNILCNSKHLLSPLLPPGRSQQYSLRRRRHNLQLPIRTSALNDKNFLIRMLFKDSYSSQSSSSM